MFSSGIEITPSCARENRTVSNIDIMVSAGFLFISTVISLKKCFIIYNIEVQK